MRRLIDLKAHPGNKVVAWMEDDNHHFGVTITHDGKIVTDVESEMIRFPFSSCPGSRLPLRELIGKPLVKRGTDIGAHVNMRYNCTHVFDLTGLAVAHAAQERDHRRYECIVPDRELPEGFERGSPQLGRTQPQLFCDGELVMALDIEGQDIIGPEKYAGHTLNVRGFRAWTETLSIEDAEYATVIRRTMLVAGGRMMDLDDQPTAAFGPGPVCYTFQPDVRDEGRRIIGNVINHEDSSKGMLANLDDESFRG